MERGIHIANEVSPEELIYFISKLTQLDPIEFVGFAQLLGSPYKEGDKPRDMDGVLSDMIDKYVTLRKKRRKEIIKLIQDVLKENRIQKKKGQSAPPNQQEGK